MISQAVTGNDLETRFAGFKAPSADQDHLLAMEVARENAARPNAGTPRIG
jgi:hypothetical protein